MWVVLDDDGQRRFVMPVPDEWRAFDADGLLALLRPDVDIGWFRTNLTVSSDEVPVDSDVVSVMAVCEARVAETYDAVDVRGSYEGQCGDAAALVHLRAFDTRADALRLSQVHAVIDAGPVHPDGTKYGGRLMYQVIATCLADDAARFQEAFTSMIGGCLVTLSPAGERPQELE